MATRLYKICKDLSEMKFTIKELESKHIDYEVEEVLVADSDGVIEKVYYINIPKKGFFKRLKDLINDIIMFFDDIFSSEFFQTLGNALLGVLFFTILGIILSHCNGGSTSF